MTKRQRAQVVELLRCAADVGDGGLLGGDGAPMVGRVAAMSFLNIEGGAIRQWAADAWASAVRDMDIQWPHRTTEVYRHEHLEAAARVEEGSYP